MKKKLLTFLMAAMIAGTGLFPVTSLAIVNVGSIPSSAYSNSKAIARNQSKWKCYKVKVKKEGVLTFTATCSGEYTTTSQDTVYVRLLDANLQEPARDTYTRYQVSANQNEISQHDVKCPVSKGTYYLCVKVIQCKGKQNTKDKSTVGYLKWKFSKVKQPKNFSFAKAVNLTSKTGKTVKIYQTPKYKTSRYYKVKLTKKQQLKIYLGYLNFGTISVYDKYGNWIPMNVKQHDGIQLDAKYGDFHNYYGYTYTSQKKLAKGWYYIVYEPTDWLGAYETEIVNLYIKKLKTGGSQTTKKSTSTSSPANKFGTSLHLS